jgi:thioester reductase-like protein
VRQAGLRGVPVVIYRPGFIGGSSTTGAWSAGDFMCRLFASLIQQESFPIDLDVLFDFSPADYVARSMVFLSRRPASRGHAFNLQNPNGIAFASVREILVDLGYRMNPMSYLRWLDVLSERRDPALYPLLPFLRDPASSEGHSNLELAQRKFRPRLSCNETVRAVAEGGIRCPAIDHALISRYLDYMAAHDLIASVSAARTRQVT